MPEQQAHSGSEPGATHTFDQLAVKQDPVLGQVVGNYHVLALAGEGSSGRVYRARDVRLDRPVALKLLNPGASKERFEQEARALARLGVHAGVVDIYTWGEHEGRCYLALEYLPESVASLIARRPGGLETGLALRIAIQCAEALAAAHCAGVVHGDLKPSNVLLGDNGALAKLCDFGLASLSAESAPHGGTPAYIAPECAAGAPVSQASDIYSLGATLYAMLAGVPPVTEAVAADALRSAAAGRVRPLAAARPDLPAALVDAIAKAMAQDPARRFASAVEFARALEGVKQPVAAPDARASKGLVRYVAMAATIVVAAFAVLIGQSFLPGGGGSAVLLADARISLNQGNYDAARTGFEDYLNAQPDNTEARYGLAYAFLLEGDHERAAQEFSRLGEAAMQSEGKAAVAYMASGEAARPALERAASDKPSGYAAVLLSMLDMMAGNFDSAKARLENVRESDLNFDWQRRQYLQTLGQIYFKSGDFAAAEQTFAKLEQGNTGAPAGVASDYIALSRERAAASERQEVGEQIARLKAMLKEAPPAADADTWTSRPLRIWIPPVEPGQGRIMQESGLADVLPWRLSRALQENVQFPITPVERGAEGAILAEQELSAALSQPGEALRLGRVMGARLLLVSKVSRLFDEELLHLTLVDTETTLQTQVGEYAITRDLAFNDWLQRVRGDLVAATAKAYPVRGRIIANGDETTLNVGASVGVTHGMRLRILPARDARALEGVEAVVSGEIGANSSTVTLEGAPASAIPPDGWLVEQAPAAKGDAHAA